MYDTDSITINFQPKMKKRLLSSALLAMSAMPLVAQSTTDWSVGEDVSSYLEWGGYDGSTEGTEYWQGTNAAYAYNEWEIFQGSDVDRYQYVWLPAGVYDFRCQGYYRDGGNDEAAQKFFAGESSKNAVLYVETGTGDPENFVVTKPYSVPFVSQWSAMNTTQLFEASDWQADASFTHGDNQYWAPNSMAGASVYFQSGLYDENSVTFILMEDGYVRLGVRKPGANLGGDWLIFTNFRIYFQGDAGEAVAIMMAQNDYEAAKDALFNFGREVLGAGYEGLAGLLEDNIMELDGELAPESVEDYEAGTQVYKNLLADYKTAFTAAKAISTIVVNCQGIADGTDFSGKPALLSAIEEAKKVLAADVFSLNGKEDFTNALKALLDARGAYLMSQEPNEDGSYDFTLSIANSFFCNDEFTPKWNGYQYVYSEDIEAQWFGDNKAWEQNATVSPQGDGMERTVLADKVVITTDAEAENVWINENKITGGYMTGYGSVIFTQGYTAVQQWSGEPTQGYSEFRQVVNGLPNGYYSASALFVNAGGDIVPGGQVIFINNGETESVGAYTTKYNGWWNNTRDGWQKVSTEIIEVKDGKVTIGMRNNNFYAATGFTLTYYGATPKYGALLAGDIQAAKEYAEASLITMGDLKAFNEIINKIPEDINSFELYEEAKQTLAEAKAYTEKAINASNSWTAIDDFMKLLEQYEEGTDEYEMVNTAFIYTLGVGQGEEDTYEVFVQSGKDYTAYVNYLAYRSSAMEYAAGSPDLVALIAAQAEELKANYADEQKLDEFKIALAAPFNAAVLASLNAGNASEAEPVDVTALIVNPSFDKGNMGWDGEVTVDGELQNAERYNTNFNVSQTIKSLPAGAYRLEVTAFYRDGGMGSPEDGAYMQWNYLALGDVEYWENANVNLYAVSNDVERRTIVTSIANATFTDPSFTEYISSWQEAEELDEEGNIVMEPVYSYINYDELAWPFDSKVEDGDFTYWFPNSMRGAYYAFQTPGVYKNYVEIMVEEGQDLTFGIRKDVTVANDWCMFDNFKLYYLGAQTPTSINNVKNTENASEIYSVSGARLNGMQKGVNIVRMSNGEVKKVFKK